MYLGINVFAEEAVKSPLMQAPLTSLNDQQLLVPIIGIRCKLCQGSSCMFRDILTPVEFEITVCFVTNLNIFSCITVGLMETTTYIYNNLALIIYYAWWLVCSLSFSVFKGFHCTNWAKDQHFGHVRDVSFRHPVKVYFGKLKVQKQWMYGKAALWCGNLFLSCFSLLMTLRS